MISRIKKILVVYKRSAYEVYFKKHRRLLRNKPFLRSSFDRFQSAHQAHYDTLQSVENTLKKHQLKYKKLVRGRAIDPRGFDLVITVGGDGTFLEAARVLKNQAIIGVNSDPRWSVGQFCKTNKKDFTAHAQDLITGKYKVRNIPRLKLKLNKQQSGINVLNDVLISHKNPAAMSHYTLMIGRIKEEQRSSGIWIATAAGSSGAIHSAGGSLLSPYRREIQYLPRELHSREGKKNRLKGGMLRLAKPMTILSLMSDGFIYVDGSHYRVSFPFGSVAEISQSSDPLRIISI